MRIENHNFCKNETGKFSPMDVAALLALKTLANLVFRRERFSRSGRSREATTDVKSND
jgi:hypothetical protein